MAPVSNLHSSHSPRGSSIYHCVNPTQHPSPAFIKSNKKQNSNNHQTVPTPHSHGIGHAVIRLFRQKSYLIVPFHLNFSSPILALLLTNIQMLPKNKVVFIPSTFLDPFYPKIWHFISAKGSMLNGFEANFEKMHILDRFPNTTDPPAKYCWQRIVYGSIILTKNSFFLQMYLHLRSKEQNKIQTFLKLVTS